MMMITTKPPRTPPTEIVHYKYKHDGRVQPTNISNLIVCESVACIIDPLDLNLGVDSLLVILSVGSLVGVTLQVKGELSRLRVGVNAVFIVEIVHEVLINCELEFRLPIIDQSIYIISVLQSCCVK